MEVGASLLTVVELAILSAVTTWIAGFGAKWLGHRMDILDHPGHRSSHQHPTPRTGGLAIILGLAAAMAAAAVMLRPPHWAIWSVGGLALILAALGFVDDIFSLRASVRFAVQFAVAATASWLFPLHLGGAPGPEQPMFWQDPMFWASLALSTLFVVAFINFFNFMDGINGIAGFQGLIGGCAICAMILIAGGDGLRAGDGCGASFSAALAAAVAGACIGFLPHNFPRARMFMGDAGSTVLGFLLAILGLKAAGESSATGNAIAGNGMEIPWIAMVLPLAVFIYDPIFTLLKRALRRENVVQAHREHHYQLLIRVGLGHAGVTLINAGLMALCAGGGILYMAVGAAQPGKAVLPVTLPGGRVMVLGGLLLVAFAYSALVYRYFRRGSGQTVDATATPASGSTEIK
jgi:UDP-N-acetylmuramyl pentapeptide phosphotransferase/UDP-N-acetylglucosamine-1-phosphate transferase